MMTLPTVLIATTLLVYSADSAVVSLCACVFKSIMLHIKRQSSLKMTLTFVSVFYSSTTF